MPGLHWPFVLAPLPPRKKKRVQPGFTDEELVYLEEVLAVIDSMHDPDDTQAHDQEAQLANHHAPELTTHSRSPSASSLASSSESPVSPPTQPLAVQSLRSRPQEPQHWVYWLFSHQSTLGIFLVFLATLLLSHSSHQGLVSVKGLLGAGCLALGLKILVASEDQALHLDPEHEGARGRARGRGRRSRRHTTSS